jgi:uncharacterized protein (TIGR00369 family)
MSKFFCVESPFVDHCFLQEEERIQDGVRSVVSLRPELMNSWGGAHGGLIATLLDASMTVAARYAAHPDGTIGVATADLSISYIGQATKTLHCEAIVTARRGRSIFAEAKAMNETGELVARAVATLRASGK